MFSCIHTRHAYFRYTYIEPIPDLWLEVLVLHANPYRYNMYKQFNLTKTNDSVLSNMFVMLTVSL